MPEVDDRRARMHRCDGACVCPPMRVDAAVLRQVVERLIRRSGASRPPIDRLAGTVDLQPAVRRARSAPHGDRAWANGRLTSSSAVQRRGVWPVE
jgi:hypothetical protein